MIYSERRLFHDIIKEIIGNYGYSFKQIDYEVKVAEDYRADCVIYSDVGLYGSTVSLIL